MNDLLDSLAEKYRSNLHLLFPKGQLPRDYSDLYPEWAQLDGFVSGLAERALSGENLDPKELEPFGYRDLRRKLEKLETEHPELAGRYLAVFDHLDDILNILRAIAREAPRTGSTGNP